MVAEPITGLVDTAFVKELGAASLGGVGAAAAVLSATLWVFNFLGVGSQTEVARAAGAGDRNRGGQIASLALILAVAFGVLVGAGLIAFAAPFADLMGAEGELREEAIRYLEVRALASPFWLITLVCFGALRGLQAMRVPLFIAVGVNVLNIGLDPLLIFGAGPVPALGVAGAAWATAISQAAGAAAGLVLLARFLEMRRPRLADLGRLLAIGRDMFIRTGLLTLFLLLATRAATRVGAEAAAAHQAIRQVWMFSALLLDAFALTAQSLVGYFVGAADPASARRVAAVTCRWSLAVGVGLAAGLLAATPLVRWGLVPPSAEDVFTAAWVASCVSQPINALSFATDGVHWGTGDFAYLRNGMIVATGAGALGLALVSSPLWAIWIVTGVWIAIRAGIGMLRIWPGLGRSPLEIR